MALQKRAAPAANVVSFKLDTFTGGFGLETGDYLLKTHRIELFEYGGASTGTTTLALRVTAQLAQINGTKFTVTGGDLPVEYSIGDPTKFGPDETGTKIVALAGATSLGKGSNFHIYLENIIGSGFDENAYDNDVSVFDDTLVHIDNIPAPERNLPQSSVNPAQQSAPRQNRTIPIVSWIYKLPGEKLVTNPRSGVTAAKGANGQPAPPTAKVTRPAAVAAAAEPEPEGGAEDLLRDILTGVIGTQKSLERTQTRIATFKAAQKAGLDVETREAVMGVFNDDATLGNVLGTIGNGYVIDGTSIIAVG